MTQYDDGAGAAGGPPDQLSPGAQRRGPHDGQAQTDSGQRQPAHPPQPYGPSQGSAFEGPQSSAYGLQQGAPYGRPPSWNDNSQQGRPPYGPQQGPVYGQQHAYGAPSGTGRRWHPALLLGAGFVAGLLVLGLVWGATSVVSATRTFTMTGSITLLASSSSSSYPSSYSSNYTTSSSGSCSGSGGYGDMYPGNTVTAYDPAGAVVGVGQMDSSSPGSSGCVFRFTISDVPAGLNFYQVEVSHRGRINISEEQASSGAAAFSLGN